MVKGTRFIFVGTLCLLLVSLAGIVVSLRAQDAGSLMGWAANAIVLFLLTLQGYIEITGRNLFGGRLTSHRVMRVSLLILITVQAVRLLEHVAAGDSMLALLFFGLLVMAYIAVNLEREEKAEHE